MTLLALAPWPYSCDRDGSQAEFVRGGARSIRTSGSLRRHWLFFRPVSERMARIRAGRQGIRPVRPKVRSFDRVPAIVSLLNGEITLRDLWGYHSRAWRLINRASETWHPRPFPPRPFSACQVKLKSAGTPSPRGAGQTPRASCPEVSSRYGWTSSDSPATKRTLAWNISPV